jgi:hypothetical protein
MVRKQQSTDKDRRAGRSRPNLGQQDAEAEKTSKEQLRHMEVEEAAVTITAHPLALAGADRRMEVKRNGSRRFS